MIEFHGVERDGRTEDRVAVLTVPVSHVASLHTAVKRAALAATSEVVAERYEGFAEDLAMVFDQLLVALADVEAEEHRGCGCRGAQECGAYCDNMPALQDTPSL